jgi:hypothetical protein
VKKRVSAAVLTLILTVAVSAPLALEAQTAVGLSPTFIAYENSIPLGVDLMARIIAGYQLKHRK